LRYLHVLVGGIGSLDRFVLTDRMLRLGRRQNALLSCVGGCPRGKTYTFK